MLSLKHFCLISNHRPSLSIGLRVFMKSTKHQKIRPRLSVYYKFNHKNTTSSAFSLSLSLSLSLNNISRNAQTTLLLVSQSTTLATRILRKILPNTEKSEIIRWLPESPPIGPSLLLIGQTTVTSIHWHFFLLLSCNEELYRYFNSLIFNTKHLSWYHTKRNDSSHFSLSICSQLPLPWSPSASLYTLWTQHSSFVNYSTINTLGLKHLKIMHPVSCFHFIPKTFFLH